MTQRLLQHDAMLAALASGATVVTASERLARALQWAYAETEQSAGHQAWQRPEVLPWQPFLLQLWTRLGTGGATNADARHVLSTVQVAAVWEEVVQGSGWAGGLLQPRAAAAAAQDAWALCQSWRFDPALFADSGNLDAEAFAAWSAAFRARSLRTDWLDAAQLPEALGAILARCRGLLPARVLFAGFHEWTPQQQMFLENLRKAGCNAERLAPNGETIVNARRIACDDTEQELRCAALWAGALLERNPAARIGIVVRDLAADGARLRRALDDALCPAARLGIESERPYNLSLGRALAEAPVIHDALLWLGLLADAEADFSTVSQLLRSPFAAAAESERAARLRLELELREGSVRVSLRELYARTQGRNDLPALAAALAAAVAWQKAQARQQLPSAWAREFAAVLRALGWPGERTRDSHEHQALEAFGGVLGEFARLDLLETRPGMPEARSRLARLLVQKIFQPASDDMPVQVMGMLEAAGLAFDHLWISGWSDDVWPASPRPDPLIPVHVQRELEMPHAGARRELEFAQRMTNQLLCAAPEVIVSSPRRDADRELRPSPLIAQLPELRVEELDRRAVVPYARLLQAQAPALETVDDRRGPAITIYKVRGGTGVLKSQAACPFQAFARYRLQARGMPVPAPGLDPKQRGSLLHAVLYRVFGELTGQAKIASADEAALMVIIRAGVAGALREMQRAQPEIFTPAFLALEQERLAQLVRAWLEVERARAPFKVAQRELDAEVRIGRLELRTRIDRLDQLASGGYAIVDYKTGNTRPAAWQGERLDEPQLPCYAVTASEEIAALLFAVLRPGFTEYRGYARASGVAPGVQEFAQLSQPPDGCADWQALLVHWRTVLTQLANDFVAGRAEVAPKDRNRTCRLCDLAPLCRIDELQALGDPPDD
ncbi:MAG: PD-(D/E)XK nuclease family protein [Gammaproteobacteria bacterium]